MKSSKVQLLPGVMKKIDWIFTNKKLIFVLTANPVPKSSSNCLAAQLHVMQIPTTENGKKLLDVILGLRSTILFS